MSNTSGSAIYNPDLTEIVEEAFERAGSELRTGYDLRDPISRSLIRGQFLAQKRYISK